MADDAGLGELAKQRARDWLGDDVEQRRRWAHTDARAAALEDRVAGIEQQIETLAAAIEELTRRQDAIGSDATLDMVEALRSDVARLVADVNARVAADAAS